MEIITPMFSNTAPSNPGKLQISLPAQHTGEGDVTLTLYDNCLIESCPKKKQTIAFDFDLKYAFTLAPPTLVF
jgi:hypothetical protein